MGIAEQGWTLRPHVGDRREVIRPHPNPEVALLPRPIALPIVDVRPVRADRLHVHA